MADGSEHRYSAASLTPDYARSAAGAALTLGPALFLDTAAAMIWLLAGAGVLFLAHGARTALRQATTYRLDDDGLTAQGPLTRSVQWADLKAVKVRYFSTRRDRTQGWMELQVQDSRQRIGLDSTLDGFAQVAQAAARAAGRRGLDLDDATRGNLAALDPRAWA